MYISVRTNENLEKTVKDLTKANLPIDVRRYEIASWISVNLKQYGYVSYVSVEFNQLVILSKETPSTIITIDLSNVFNIYDLD